MIDKITPEKLKDPHINDDANHLAAAMRYAIAAQLRQALRHIPSPVYVQQPELKAYACECKHCDITSYTNFKQLNCRYCGSSDPDVFTCTELKE